MSSDNSVYKVVPGSLNKTLVVPTSKSHANRMIVLAALSKEEVVIHNMSDSSDVTAMLNCIQEVGVHVTSNGTSYTFHNSFPDCEVISDKVITLDTGDGGTTNRFLMGFLANGSNTYELNADGHMRNRPMEDLAEPLRKMNVDVTRGEDFWYRIKGPFSSEELKIEVDCSDSTQFATALLLGTSNNKIEIIPHNLRTSLSYWNMSQALVKEMSEGVQEWTVPVDSSSLAYPLALALVDGKVTVSNCLDLDILQADSIFVKWAEDIGAIISFDENGLTLESREVYSPLDRDCSNCPDLVPTLAFVASLCDGTSYFRNIKVLRHKESDRIEETMNFLRAMGVKHQYDEIHDVLEIEGPFKTDGEVELTPPEDHRMVMVSFLFLRSNGGGTLTNTHHVAKSFPTFFDVMGA